MKQGVLILWHFPGSCKGRPSGLSYLIHAPSQSPHVLCNGSSSTNFPWTSVSPEEAAQRRGQVLMLARV